MSRSALEQQLEKIEQQLTDTNRLPVPTLEIIGEEQVEKYWQALLVYFLDGNNPHGFETDVLSAFLKAVESHAETDFERGNHDLDQVDIQVEVPTGTGPVDLLLSLDEAWFMCIELKVGSPETGDQTVRYANAASLGDVVVSEHDGTGEYLYLAPESAPAPSSEKFTLIPWHTVVTHLDNVLREGYGQYPSKSSAQLADYLDTIKRELNMTDADEVSKETELYIQHHDLIDRLKEAYENDRNTLFRDIKSAFFAEGDIKPNNWQVNNSPRGYINFYKEPWQNLESGTRIEYEPHLQLKTDHPRIRLRLDIEKGDKDAIREELRNRLGEEQLEELRANDWEITDGTYGYLAKSVPINLNSADESVRYAMQELHHFRTIVEPHIEKIVSNYQKK